jgi:hypothetical protein
MDPNFMKILKQTFAGYSIIDLSNSCRSSEQFAKYSKMAIKKPNCIFIVKDIDNNPIFQLYNKHTNAGVEIILLNGDNFVSVTKGKSNDNIIEQIKKLLNPPKQICKLCNNKVTCRCTHIPCSHCGESLCHMCEPKMITIDQTAKTATFNCPFCYRSTDIKIDNENK